MTYSRLVIGLFGLVGMAGVALGPFVGRGLDKMVPWYGTLFAIVMSLVFQAVETGAGGINVAAVVIATIGLDVFRQMIQVSLTTAVFGWGYFHWFRSLCVLTSLFSGFRYLPARG